MSREIRKGDIVMRLFSGDRMRVEQHYGDFVFVSYSKGGQKHTGYWMLNDLFVATR